MRPSDGRNGPVSFADLMELEKIDSFTFRSVTAAFKPGNTAGNDQTKKGERLRTYGGHVYAQAVWAAAHTVKEGLVVHSVTGFFTSLGLPDVPFVYNVKTIRDGKSYMVRFVEVTQPASSGVCFTCTCSFKRPSPGPIELQDRVDLNERYSSVLQGKRPEEHPDYLTTESPVVLRQIFKDPSFVKRFTPFPGLVTKKVDMKPYNEHRTPRDRRQLHFYKGVGTFPRFASAPNLHACAHLYASDRNSLFVVTRHLALDFNIGAMTSLSHTVIFHTTGDSLAMADERGELAWVTQEAWTDRYEDERGTHHSRIFDARGRHIATTLQDGLIRLNFADEAEMKEAKAELDGGNVRRLKL